MGEEKDVVKQVVVETIEKLRGLLREGDRLTIAPKSTRLMQWGSVKALGVDVVAHFLAKEE